ncbi:efflux RND transporter periplasmic adaptor subunit [Halocynthiibacter styelae]|uniref:Efflux transporter periplasmic adaptor subunit n=1 Tax=Halocynthiibacter styelae TaxID=2761955 RepID=A0A8J7LL04_9RHOB|nr:HlyD family efflux transporter periplasmic adaptor subunit [Paenihalocynthiibacter styelae]MBI1493689.1 efflux transporter periplasmic adaptor subunit [Paenihalocynthiibacter styelae]
MRFLTRSLTGLFILALTLGLLAMSVLTVLSALSSRGEGREYGAGSRERVFSVNVITPEAEDLHPELTLFGEIRARRSLELRAATAGRVIELADNFVDGGVVQAGQLLARVDPAEARSALDSALNSQAEAQANLRDAERSLVLAQDDLTASEAQRDLREAALSRQRDLLARGAGTAASVETAELAGSQAVQAVVSRRLSLAQAEARLDQAKTGLSRQELVVADTERRLKDTEVFAEFTGTLGEVSVVQGGLLSTNERLATLTDASEFEVSFRTSTAQYSRLLDDSGALNSLPVTVTLDVLGVDLTSTGRVTRESGTVGAGQTGRLLFARLETTAGFRPGDFVTVKLQEPQLQNVALLPATAWDADGTVLAVNDENRLLSLPAQLLRRQGNDVIVAADGLAGQRIVAERSPLLGAGILVRPIDPDAPEVQADELIELSDDRRAALIAFVQANERMPDDARSRVLNQLAEPRVPARVVERIESRMGG